MRLVFGFVFISALSAALCLADTASNSNEIKRLNSINPIIRQLEIVSVNLNQLQSVLNEMGSEFTKMTFASANKRESTEAKQQQNSLAKMFSETMSNMMQEVDNARKVATELTGQLSSYLTSRTRLPTGSRSRRSVQLNEPNLEQLSQLIQLLRGGPESLNRRVRRQAPSGPPSIISSTMETASNGLQDLLQVATSLSNGIRRRLSNVSTQIADLTASGVLSLNQAATNTVQGATNVLSSIGSSAVNGVNTVTTSVNKAITNGVKQVNAIAQNTLG